VRVIRAVGLILLLATFAVTQEIAIKGYRIGETKTEYLQDHPELQAFLAICHIDRKEYERQKCGKPHKFDVNYDLCVMNLHLDKCNYLVPGFDGQERMSLSCDMLSTTPKLDERSVCAWASGKDGRLISIFAHFDDYDEVKAGVTAKAKVEPMEISVSSQNGFGARWVDRVATWKTAVNCATLTEDNSPAHAGIRLRNSLQIEPRATCDEREKAAAGKGNPLD
jgi:hypothetical protein